MVFLSCSGPNHKLARCTYPAKYHDKAQHKDPEQPGTKLGHVGAFEKMPLECPGYVPFGTALWNLRVTRSPPQALSHNRAMSGLRCWWVIIF